MSRRENLDESANYASGPNIAMNDLLDDIDDIDKQSNEDDRDED